MRSGLRREQVGGERAGRHRVGEPARRAGVGGQRVGGRVALPHRVGHALQADEGGVGVGRQRQRRRHHREHVREHLAHPGRGVDQALQHLVRAARVREPEARPAAPASPRGPRPGSGAGRPGERLQQRAVEEPLVDARARCRWCARTRPAARRHRGGRASARSWCARAGRRAGRGSAGRARSAGGAPGGAGTGRRRRAPRRRSAPRSPPPPACPARCSVLGSRSRGSRRPCTICRSWTANSTSRIPPRPRFTSVNSLPRWRMYSSSRTLVRRTSSIACGGSSPG